MKKMTHTVPGMFARINKAVKAGTDYKVFVLDTIDPAGRWGYTEHLTLEDAKRSAALYRAAGHTDIDIFVTAREV